MFGKKGFRLILTETKMHSNRCFNFKQLKRKERSKLFNCKGIGSDV